MHDIEALFALGGSAGYYGEPVTQLAHALQCAQLAEDAGASRATVVAALLHDIGHLLPGETPADYMDALGRVDHERLGADWLAVCGFPTAVTELIRHHVNAKRYLVFSQPAYARALSDASRETLARQGGPMEADEAAMFERHPYFHEILQLRRWDEQAKQPGRPTPELAHYVAICNEYLKSLPPTP